ncbi:Crp/Fnr family transcriptional regulator [Stratiformator vulcanicus]|uniref:cAMP receptor protein n=1 Tax=Stratiformator vulcanicus TaxID=2527980 RepID=A0A517R5S5_9PLAN|nr:cyclic nucleotide-binding domain-containing protein [Stratiformator vulcanicus]QDT39210.1 cAMP receptor protein [Stratiformator vulcanicus]
MQVTEDDLACCGIFRELTPAHRREFLELVEVREYEAGRTILEEGGETRNIWFIIAGVCRVEMETDNGETHELARLERGSLFGEMSFFNPAPHSASVIADTDVRVLRMSSEQFAQLEISGLRPAYHIARETAVILSERLRKMDEWVSKLVARDSEEPQRQEWAEFRAKLYTNWEF